MGAFDFASGLLAIVTQVSILLFIKRKGEKIHQKVIRTGFTGYAIEVNFFPTLIPPCSFLYFVVSKTIRLQARVLT